MTRPALELMMQTGLLVFMAELEQLEFPKLPQYTRSLNMGTPKEGSLIDFRKPYEAPTWCFTAKNLL